MEIQQRKFRKKRNGEVISNKANKSITVKISRRVQHPMYGKFITKTSKIYAHDEKNECAIGDKIVVMETRPLSKNKRWRLCKILQKQ